MSSKIYPMSSQMTARISMKDGSATVRLAPSDIPGGFTVGTEAKASELRMHISVTYPHSMQEERVYSKSGRVEVGIGKFSQRIFEVIMTLPLPVPLQVPAEMERLADNIRKALQSAFRELGERTSVERAKMNYSAAGTGILARDDEDGQIPAWMSDALESLRSERTSNSGIPPR